MAVKKAALLLCQLLKAYREQFGSIPKEAVTKLLNFLAVPLCVAKLLVPIVPMLQGTGPAHNVGFKTNGS